MYLLILITCFPGNVAILQGEIILQSPRRDKAKANRTFSGGR